MSEHPDQLATLRRRAQRLATPPPPPASTDRFEALGFVWAGVRFLVAASRVRETVRVSSATGVAAVPGAVPPLLGVVTVRAEALPVVDPRPLLGLPAPSRVVPAVVVLEHGGRPSLALAADDLQRLVLLELAELHAPPAGGDIVRAVTSDGASLLDADVLLDLPPFFRTPEGIFR